MNSEISDVQSGVEPMVILLWNEKIIERSAKECSLSVYLPPSGTANGSAVIIFPGGGYEHLADVHEGSDCARWLNARGVTAFVLKYRLHPYAMHPAPLMDAQRAIRIVRSQAAEWGIHPQRIGIWGFSAGGHLASTAATHFDSERSDVEDVVERASCRPDFLILGYPVVTMRDDYTHTGTRNCVIGENPSAEMVEHLSNENCVTPETPPTFLFHTDEDQGVPSENSVNFYLALRRAGVPAELHIYRTGPHGVGLAQQYHLLKTWPDLLESWMCGLALLNSNLPTEAKHDEN